MEIFMKQNEEQKKEHTPLSASRIRVFENCSYIYYSNYILKAPQSSNDGASKGSICHEAFEFLLEHKNKPEYDKIIAANSISASEFILKQVQDSIAKLKLPLDSFNHIEKMILTGLKHDFFVKGSKLVGIEYAFDYVNEDPPFRLKGFLDKIHKNGKNILIHDYKSSKKKYEGEEASANIQAFSYALIATKLWPKLKPIVKFIFLQFPEDPIVETLINENVLKGFEAYLAYIQEKINNFSEADATGNMAADKSYGTNTFTGKLICGMGKYPNQLKKDGSKMYACPYRWAYDYFVIVKDGIVIKTSLNKEDLVAKDGETIEIKHFDGCPRWRNPLSGFEAKPVKIDNGDLFDF
jgi:hypothetical protein